MFFYVDSHQKYTKTISMEQKTYLTETEWNQVIAKAWRDQSFRQQLESNPDVAVRTEFPNFEFKRIYRVANPPVELEEEHLDEIIDGTSKALLAGGAIATC